MRPLTLMLSMLFFAGLAARGQSISGFTTVDIDQDSGMVTAQCETDMDGDVTGYYAPFVQCVVVDSNGNQVAIQTDSEEAGSSVAQVIIQIQGTPGITYTATGKHRAVVEYSQDDPDYGGDPNENNLIDAYNFQQVTNSDTPNAGSNYPTS